jgi:isopentenyl-diphosphate Delta-isomerase
MTSTYQWSREKSIVDLVDENGNSIGKDTVDAAHRAPGRLHRAFSVMLFDDSGRILLQQRAATKRRFAGLWGPSCCGHLAPGADLHAAAVSRIKEELGLTVDFLEVIGHCTYVIQDHDGQTVEHEYDHVLVGRTDGIPSPDSDEIAALRWITTTELASELGANDGRYGLWLCHVMGVINEWHGR